MRRSRPVLVVSTGPTVIVWAVVALVTSTPDRKAVVRVGPIAAVVRMDDPSVLADWIAAAWKHAGASLLHVDACDCWTRARCWEGLDVSWRVHALREGDGAELYAGLVREGSLRVARSRVAPADLERLGRFVALLHDRGEIEDAGLEATAHGRTLRGVAIGEDDGREVVLREGRLLVGSVDTDRAFAAQLMPALRRRP